MQKATLTATPAAASSSTAPRPAGTASTHLVATPKKPAPDCCVHIQSDTLAGISPQNPKPGRIDCPETPEWHGRDVTVIGLEGDGTGGMLAHVLFEEMPGQSRPGTPEPWIRQKNVSVAPKLIPVCSVGSQKKPPVGCCLAYGRDNRTLVVMCEDPSHPLHGKPAEKATKEGYTLQMCEQPPNVPPCCFELGDFGDGNNARLICEDENHPAHGKGVKVTVSPDGTTGVWRGEIEGTRYVLEMPVCVIEEEPEEVPCCVTDGVLECPGTPYHGMSYEVFKKSHDGMRLLPCPEVPPPPPPGDCCVRVDKNRAFLVCSSGPWNGYELKPNEFSCVDTAQGTVCRTSLKNADGSSAGSATFPVCGPGQEPVPPDCCYDPGTGRLVCSDTASEYHNLQVSLLDMQSGLPHANGWALVYHRLFGSTPMKFPLCDVSVPPECCFELPDPATPGSKGKIVCPGHELDGQTATLIALAKLPNGTVVASVTYLGGASRMQVCPPEKRPPPPSKIPPPEKKPPPPGKIPTPEECPPCYFCCVNLDTVRFVCPGDPALHGQVANIQQVVEIQGAPWVVLADGRKVPACGIECPPPTPECPPLLIPSPIPGTNTPPGPKMPPPCEPGPEIPSPTPGTNTPPGPPAEPPCEPAPAIPTAPPGTNTPPGPPSAPPCEPAPAIPTMPPGTNTPPGPPSAPPCEPQPAIPTMPPGTNTPPGPPSAPPCEPQPAIPTRPPGTNTPPGPPGMPPCEPQPAIPTRSSGTNTPLGPPAPYCTPDSKPNIPRPPPYV